MRVLKTMLTLLVLTNWLVCTAHCQFEQAGLCHKAAEQCSLNVQTPPADCQADDGPVCDWIISGGLQKSDAGVSAPEFVALPLADFLRVAFDNVSANPEPPGHNQSSIVPPEFSSSVLFVLRTALPARAPSFLS